MYLTTLSVIGNYFAFGRYLKQDVQELREGLSDIKDGLGEIREGLGGIKNNLEAMIAQQKEIGLVSDAVVRRMLDDRGKKGWDG